MYHLVFVYGSHVYSWRVVVKTVMLLICDFFFLENPLIKIRPVRIFWDRYKKKREREYG